VRNMKENLKHTIQKDLNGLIFETRQGILEHLLELFIYFYHFLRDLLGVKPMKQHLLIVYIFLLFLKFYKHDCTSRLLRADNSVIFTIDTGPIGYMSRTWYRILETICVLFICFSYFMKLKHLPPE